MSRRIVLLRGINVGGRNRLSMSDLRAALAATGCTGIATYIQSGNAVVTRRSGNNLADALRRELARRHGIEPAVMVIAASKLAAILAANPYAGDPSAPASVHVYFLEASPAGDAGARLDAARAPSESFELSDQVLYLHAPDGIGRSRLVKGLDRALGVPATGRNWRTLSALAAMADIEG